MLITGHTGFKGSWLSIWLKSLGAIVVGYALPPATTPNMFNAAGLYNHLINIEGDIRDKQHLEQVLVEHKPDMVFHLAAQPIVRLSYELPHYSFETNIMGTVNLLEAVRKTESVRVCTVITSDKCYENKEWIYAYRENDPLGGYDPYSASKACAELVVGSYQQSFFHPTEYKQHQTALSSVRAGNVIGGGDWGMDRIVPDCVRALTSNKPITVRNPQAIRPWQHVLEPLSGYLWLSALMWDQGSTYSSAWNFGPHNFDNITVGELADKIVEYWGNGYWQDASVQKNNQMHEANHLKLDCTKSQNLLGCFPVYRIDEAIKMTLDWYRAFYASDENIYVLTLSQIQAYVNKAQQMGLPWIGKDGYNDSQR